MKKDVLISVAGIFVILAAGCFIYFIPYGQAAKQQSVEDEMIDEYLEQSLDIEGVEDKKLDNYEETSMVYAYSDVDSAAYKGEIDSILVIDKINLKKAIIRGEYNDYNLDRYFFVTADQQSKLGTDNYIIYGHCSQTYGHSFNRLEELAAGDEFQLIQGTKTYHYIVRDVRRELREDAAPYLYTGANTVQLLSCEKKKAEGYSEKRLIIVTAEQQE